MNYQLIDNELESLSTLHIAHEGGDSFYFQSGYFERTDNIVFKEFFERDNLIMTAKEAKMISQGIRSEKQVDNEISDWELVTIAITVEAEGLDISRTEALEHLMDMYVYPMWVYLTL
jgi:hypothetical protein